MKLRGHCTQCGHKQTWLHCPEVPDPACDHCDQDVLITAKLTPRGWRKWTPTLTNSYLTLDPATGKVGLSFT